MGAQPALEIVGKEDLVTVLNHEDGTRTESISEDPMKTPVHLSLDWKPVPLEGLPSAFCGEK